MGIVSVTEILKKVLYASVTARGGIVTIASRRVPLRHYAIHMDSKCQVL
jgi:hypothetical protein